MPRDMGDRRRGRKGRAQASSGRPGQESAASLVDFYCRRVGEEYRFAERDGFARDAAAGGQGHKGEFALCLSEQREIDRRGEVRGVEIRAADAQAVGVRVADSVARVVGSAWVRNLEPLVEMQFARAAIVIEAVGAVDILLHLDDGQPAADGVYRPGAVVDEIVRSEEHTSNSSH